MAAEDASGGRGMPEFGRAELIDAVREVSPNGEIPPTPIEVIESDAVAMESTDPFVEMFGSYAEAVIAAGFEGDPITDRPGYDTASLIEAIHDASDGDDPPVYRAVVRSAESSVASMDPFLRVFGTFPRALQVAGFDKDQCHESRGGGQRPEFSREGLLKAIEIAAPDDGNAPTFDDVKESEFPVHSKGPFIRVFGSWTEAIHEAGFDKINRGGGGTEKIPVDTLLFDYCTGWEAMGHKPTTDEYNLYGTHSPITLSRRFGGWDGVKDAADVYVRENNDLFGIDPDHE